MFCVFLYKPINLRLEAAHNVERSSINPSIHPESLRVECWLELTGFCPGPDGAGSAAQAGTYLRPISSNMNELSQVHQLGFELLRLVFVLHFSDDSAERKKSYEMFHGSDDGVRRGSTTVMIAFIDN